MPEIKNTARSAPTGSLTLLACALLLAVPCLAGGGPQDKDEKKAPAKKAAQVVIKPAVLKPAVLKKADGKKLPLGEAVEALKNAIKGEETKPEAAKETAAAGKASEEGKVRRNMVLPKHAEMMRMRRLNNAGAGARSAIVPNENRKRLFWTRRIWISLAKQSPSGNVRQLRRYVLVLFTSCDVADIYPAKAQASKAWSPGGY